MSTGSNRRVDLGPGGKKTPLLVGLFTEQNQGFCECVCVKLHLLTVGLGVTSKLSCILLVILNRSDVLFAHIFPTFIVIYCNFIVIYYFLIYLLFILIFDYFVFYFYRFY